MRLWDRGRGTKPGDELVPGSSARQHPASSGVSPKLGLTPEEGLMLLTGIFPRIGTWASNHSCWFRAARLPFPRKHAD